MIPNTAETYQPSPLFFEDQVFDLAFHPQEDIIAAVKAHNFYINEFFSYKYAKDLNTANENLFHIRPHRKSCRGLEFNHQGNGKDGRLIADQMQALYSVSKDKSIQVIDALTGIIFIRKADAHDEPINCVRRLNEQLLATGDDGGLWDIRQGNEIMEYSEHEDFISDFAFSQESKTLLATSGDGALSVYDIRRPNLVAMSDNQEDELLSIAIVKDGRKVVVGSQEGILNLFSWGNWGDISDRFPGHPNSIDTIVKITEDLICTGSSDGIIRLVEARLYLGIAGILPNKFKGVIGDHEDLPIERIRLSYDQQYLASCSHDNSVKFWDVGFLVNLEDEFDDNCSEGDSGANMDTDDSDTEEETIPSQFKNNRGLGSGSTNGFFADL
ncbi:hypothetical protein G9A89_009627 [Geosiphon pyriformis]|nr:hypothetical protein G9A89_009627 [Geosiphon pyriformis]